MRKRRARGDLGEERRPRGIHLRVKALCKSQLKLRPVCSQRNIARWGIHVRPTLCLDLATQDCGAWAITVTIKSAPRDARRKMGLNSWSTFIDQCLAGTHRMPCLNVWRKKGIFLLKGLRHLKARVHFFCHHFLQLHSSENTGLWQLPKFSSAFKTCKMYISKAVSRLSKIQDEEKKGKGWPGRGKEAKRYTLESQSPL